MPKFVIERQYLVPMYQHIVIEAETLEEACKTAISDDIGWDTQAMDCDSARATHTAGNHHLRPLKSACLSRGSSHGSNSSLRSLMNTARDDATVATSAAVGWYNLQSPPVATIVFVSI
jgi:hypothetical protein